LRGRGGAGEARARRLPRSHRSPHRAPRIAALTSRVQDRGRPSS
jgi:hypothetical protein